MERIRTNEFVIIANNCWGGEVYRDLNFPYNTPFIGLFIPPTCYLRLLKNFEAHISSKLTFINSSKYEVYGSLKEQNPNYPIGILSNDIEIHFLHYHNVEEAKEKWERRLKRLKENNNYFFKFCDREITDINLLLEFDSLPLKNKVCFTVKNIKAKNKNIIQIKEQDHLPQVVDGRALYNISKNYFDIQRWLLTGNSSLYFIDKLRLRVRLFKITLKQIIRR